MYSNFPYIHLSSNLHIKPLCAACKEKKKSQGRIYYHHRENELCVGKVFPTMLKSSLSCAPFGTALSVMCGIICHPVILFYEVPTSVFHFRANLTLTPPSQSDRQPPSSSSPSPRLPTIQTTKSKQILRKPSTSPDRWTQTSCCTQLKTSNLWLVHWSDWILNGFLIDLLLFCYMSIVFNLNEWHLSDACSFYITPFVSFLSTAILGEETQWS